MRTKPASQSLNGIRAFLEKLRSLVLLAWKIAWQGKRRKWVALGILGVIAVSAALLWRSLNWRTPDYDLLPLGYVPDDITQVTLVTDVPWKKTISVLDRIYLDAINGKDTDHKFPEILRRFRFFVTYDDLSQSRFRRTFYNMPHHRNAQELMDAFLQHEWTIQKIEAASSMPFSDAVMLRFIISLHTASHFFEVPLSTLFCLVFFESKFDEMAVNPIGGKGMGQLTPIALEQLHINRKGAPDLERLIHAASLHLNNIYRDEFVNKVVRHIGFDVSFPDLGKFPKSHISMARGDPLKYGTVFNLETNVLLSAMLLRYYMDFSWRVHGEEFEPSLPSRMAMAVAAYHRGPGAVGPYIRQFYRGNPKDMETAFETSLDSELSAYVRRIQDCSCKD